MTLLIITRRGLTVRPWPIAACRSTRKTDRPSDLRGCGSPCAREQDHRVGVLDARDVHLAAVDDVDVAVDGSRSCAATSCPCRPRARSRRRPAGAARRWRSSAGTRASAPRCRAAAACPSCRPARARAARCRRERLISSRITLVSARLEAHAAVLGRDQRAEEAGLGHRRDERLGVLAPGVEVAPVGVGEAVADGADRGAEIVVHDAQLIRARGRRSRADRAGAGATFVSRFAPASARRARRRLELSRRTRRPASTASCSRCSTPRASSADQLRGRSRVSVISASRSSTRRPAVGCQWRGWARGR